MTESFHIVGAGGHGRVVLDLVQSCHPGRQVIWYDDAWKNLIPVFPIEEIHPVEDLLQRPPSNDCFVAIGNATHRLKLIERLRRRGHGANSLVHPSAVCSPYCKVGSGSVLMAGSIVQTGVVLGEGTIVNTSASVDHDCRLGRGVHVAPGARLAGDVTVGEKSWIGIGAVVREGITIGSNVLIGAGAVVVRNLPDNAKVVGNPARSMKE